MPGLVGKKVGMTSVFDENGVNVPCTVLEVGPCTVTQVKTEESDGYKAIQLAFDDKKEKNTPAAMKGHFKSQHALRNVNWLNLPVLYAIGKQVMLLPWIILRMTHGLMLLLFLRERDSRVLLPVTDSAVSVIPHTDSTTGRELRDHLADHHGLHACLEVCVWPGKPEKRM